MKKFNEVKQNEHFCIQFEIFWRNDHPTRHIKHKVIIFAPSTTSIKAKKLRLINLERFLRRNKSSFTRQ